MPFSRKKGHKISGKSFKITTDNLPNRKYQESPRKKMNIKTKAGNSFSIPRKIRSKAPITNNLEHKIAGKVFKAKTDNLPKRKYQESPRKKMNIKTKAGNSFSIPRKIRSKAPISNNLLNLQSRQQEKITNERNKDSRNFTNDDREEDTNSNITDSEELSSTPLESSEDDLELDPDWVITDKEEQLQSPENDLERDPDWEITDKEEQLQSPEDDLEEDVEWETEDSVEQLRSSEFSDFVHHGGNPISSTPFSPTKEKGFHFTDIAVPDVSHIKPHDYENHTLVDLAVPDVSYINTQDYENDTLTDFFTNPEVSISTEFDVSGIPNESIEPNFYDKNVETNFADEKEVENFDDEYVEKHFDFVYIEQIFDKEHSEQNFDEKEEANIKNSFQVKHRKKKRNNKVKNFSKNIDNSSSEDSFGDNQNTVINMRRKKGKCYRGGLSKSNNRRNITLKKTIEEDSSAYINNSYAENNLKNAQNVQNEGWHCDEMDNNLLKTALHQTRGKRNKHLSLGNKKQKDAISILDESQNSNLGMRNSKDTENFNHEYKSFNHEDNGPNFSNEYVKQNFENNSDEEDRATVLRSPLSVKHQNRKQKNEEENFCGEMDNGHNFSNEYVEQNFDTEYFENNSDEEDRATVLRCPLGVKHQNSKQKNKVENFSGDMDNGSNFSNECVEQNFGTEYFENNSDEEDRATVLRCPLGVKHQNGKQKNKVENFSFDMDNYNSVDSFKDNRNTQTDTPKKKGKFYRGVGLKSNSRQDKLLRNTIEEENLFTHINNNDTENNLANVQNIQDQDLLVDKSDNNQPKSVSYQTGRKRNKNLGVGNETQQNVVSVLNASQNFIQKTKVLKNRQNSGKSILKYGSVDNLEEAQNIQIQSSLKKRKNERNSRLEPYRSISRLKNATNSLSGTQQDASSIPNGPRNSNLERGRKLKNNLEKSGEDIFGFNEEGNLEDQNIQIDFPVKKGKSVRGVGNKRCNRGNRSKTAIVQKKNEAKKFTWPICCLTDMVPTKVNTLQPVILEGVPIDCITLMLLEKDSKEKCQHC